MNPYSYKKILVPVDLSESSLNALETAASLAVRKKARLFILHVEDDSLDFLPNEKTGFQTEELSSDVVMALANAIQHK
ncbi:MAG TPA: universal stress protein, partial [Flavisolibacter sp.]